MDDETELTMSQLRLALKRQIERVENDETTPAKANAITNATSQILRSAKLQMEYAAALGKTPNVPLLASES